MCHRPLTDLATPQGYGEDPYLTAEIARVWIRGMQGGPTAKFMKVGTIAKHFAAHTGPESPNNEQGVGRMAFDTVVSQVRKTPSWPRSWANVSLFLYGCSCVPTAMHGPTCIVWASLTPFSRQRALHAHFLLPFKAAAEAGTVGFMCSYNGTHL
jgi:hypothetical protein